ncbi:hypothetical protein D3C86_2095410 [compost metagenome]
MYTDTFGRSFYLHIVGNALLYEPTKQITYGWLSRFIAKQPRNNPILHDAANAFGMNFFIAQQHVT